MCLLFIKYLKIVNYQNIVDLLMVTAFHEVVSVSMCFHFDNPFLLPPETSYLAGAL